MLPAALSAYDGREGDWICIECEEMDGTGYGPSRSTTEEAQMKVVHCPCGVDVSGETDDELVANVEAHVAADHPEQVGKHSRESILEMAHEH